MRRRVRHRGLKIALVAAVVAVCLAAVAFFVSGRLLQAKGQDYIAHGGGAIDGYTLTNSLEAVENSLSKGIKYIELDLQQTSDGKLVATHDWSTFKMQAGSKAVDGKPLTLNEFKNSMIYGRFTPLTAEMIDSLFAVHKDAVIVTDKTDNAELIKMSLPRVSDRVIVECFSPPAYKACEEAGLKAMRSYHNFMPNGINVVGEDGERYYYLHLLPTRFAVFPQKHISMKEADEMFKADSRIRFVYVDFIE